MRKAAAAFGAVGLVALTSLSAGIFLFDHRLIVFKKALPQKISIFTNMPGLGPLWNATLGMTILLGLSVLVFGFLRSRKTGRGFAESAFLQSLTLVPLLALVFGRFVYGKYLKSLFPIPLYPLLVAAVMVAVLWRNASLHFGFRLRDVFTIKRDFSGTPERPGRAKTALLIAPLLLLFVHLMSLSPFYQRFTGLLIFTGDEPKYLRTAYSLASDGDLDVSNNFVGDELEVDWLLQKQRASGERRFGDLSVVGRDGGVYHLHLPGTSFLMLPGFFLDLAVFPRDIPNTQGLMFLPAKMAFTRLVFLVLALGIFAAAARLFIRMFRSPVIAAVLILALMLATKIPEYFFQVYPESAAIFLLLLGLNAVFYPFRRSGANAFALILASGFLPWLHQRFLPLAVGLYGIYLFREIVENKKGKRALIVSMGLAVFGFGYLYYFYAVTGSPLPWSMYGLWGTTYTHAAMLPSGFFGYLFDTGSGLLSLTPVFFFSLAGIFWGIKLDRRRALMLLALILPYFALINITPWHGSAWETTRMSLALYPLFLLFFGYALRALTAHTSWAHLVFYAAGLGFVLLNRTHRIWDIRLGNALILPHQVGYIIQGAFVLAGFYLVLWGLDLWTKKSLGAFSLEGIHEFFQGARGRIRAVFGSPVLRKSLVVLAVGLPAAYIPVFLANWDDRTMALSYFSALNKVAKSKTVALHPRGHPSAAVIKGEEKFVDIFKWEVPVELLPKKKITTVRLGPGVFEDMSPAGCYKVDLEFYDAPPELTFLSLVFMGEVRGMRVYPQLGRTLVSTIYLVFRDTPVPQTFSLRHEGFLTRPVKGRLSFFPIPSVVFDKTVMVRLSEDLYPDSVQAGGPFPYLGFVANSLRDQARFTFALSLLSGPDAGEPASPRPLSSHAVLFRNRLRHRFDIKLDLPPEVRAEGDALAFSVKNARGNALAARSAWLDVRDGAWLIPLRPPVL